MRQLFEGDSSFYTASNGFRDLQPHQLLDAERPVEAQISSGSNPFDFVKNKGWSFASRAFKKRDNLKNRAAIIKLQQFIFIRFSKRHSYILLFNIRWV
jgi:hypothetical protein